MARRIGSGVAAPVALLPATLIALLVYCGATGWTVWISLTSSRMLPNGVFVGARQYASLLANDRWQVSVRNLAVFGLLFVVAALIVGFLLAVLIDQRVRAEGVLRTVFLYPFSMSFIVTGLAWRWLLDPTLGIEKLLHDAGFAAARFDWLVRPDRVIYCLVFAAIWHASGLVMAIMLAGLRGIDPELWKAARVDGLPPWRVYAQVIVPMLGASVATATILLATSVVRLYDLVVAMTSGGPGVASEVPAKFVMDYLFERQNIGLATAAATTMLATIAAVLAPLLYVQSRRAAGRPA